MKHVHASLVIALALFAPTTTASTQEAPRNRAHIDVRVDPRVELLTTVARLAGFAEFNMANSNSPYSVRVEQRFGPHAEHAVVATLRELRAERGVSYDAIASLAMHLDAASTLAERIPFDAQPERLDARWGVEGARKFVAQLRDFAELTKAGEFFESERAFYAAVEERLSQRLSQSKALPWFDAFFGAKAGARYVAVAGLLCGGGNFGVGVRFADGTPEEVTPVFGCWTFDEQGVPLFGDAYLPLFVHELCHTYTNPFVDRFERELSASGAALHASCAEAMARQSYGTWKTMVYESLVRASVVRCRLVTEGRDAAMAQAQEEVGKHFAWVPELAKLFGDYESDRARYASFEAFMPRVVEFFDAYAARAAELATKTPKVVLLSPANGAIDVDPATSEFVVHFDRAMRDQSWSILGAKRDQPEFTGTPVYDAERKVLRMPMRLEPGRTYRFALNSATSKGFTSQDGVALAPLQVTFTTR